MLSKHKISAAFAALLCCASAAPAPAPFVSAPNTSATDATYITASAGYRNVAYFANWGIYARNFQPYQVPATHLTHLQYAFFGVNTDGSLKSLDTYADYQKHYSNDSWNDPTENTNLYGNLKQIYLLKKHNRNLKIALSIGGWNDGNPPFVPAALTAAGQATFVNSSITMVKDLGFDGIDIDWEYPANDDDATAFVQLLQQLRVGLDTYAAQYAPGYHFEITIAAPAGPSNYNVLHLAQMDAYLDAWNLMAYDYAGSWDNITGHQANLYPSVSNPASTPYSTQKAVGDFIAAGIAANKIVLGMPLYGRAFEETAGPGTPFTGVGYAQTPGSYEAGVWDYKALPKAGATEYLDSSAGASYSYDASAQEFISYDTPAMAQAKATYLKNAGLGGAMFWECSGDKNGSDSLISTLYDSYSGVIEMKQNLLAYPASQYTNLAAGMPGE